MNTFQKKVIDFLSMNNMNPYSIDMNKYCNLFMDEMIVGLNVNNGGTLLMLPTYIESREIIPIGEPVTVIDAGGTNLRVALLSFSSTKQAVIEYHETYKMPGSVGEVTSDEFYETLYEYLLPILDKSDKIGFCFSYPVEIYPNKDGKLLRFTKEMKITGLIGSMVGEGLLNKISEKARHGKKSLVMLNDTTATLLGGRAAFPGRVFEGYIGMILGTGYNLAYIEKTHKIGKIPEYKDSDDSMIINMEAGNFGKGPFGKIDDDFNAETATPGQYRMEKSLSGAYQGGLILTAIKGAVADGLFSEEFSKRLASLNGLTSKDIDDFLFYPYSPVQSVLSSLIPDSGDADRMTLYYIIDSIMERAAINVTFALTAIMKKTETGKNPCAPVCVTAEGSTFYKSKLLQSKISHYVKTYANDTENLYLEFVKADHCVIIGTAIAALQNTALSVPG